MLESCVGVGGVGTAHYQSGGLESQTALGDGADNPQEGTKIEETINRAHSLPPYRTRKEQSLIINPSE